MGGESRFLVYGFGNPGRLDDGLGPACAAELKAMDLRGLRVDADYQLTIEDAWEVARHPCVIFVDASLDGPAPWSLQELEPVHRPHFSSHLLDPASVLGLAHKVYGSKTRGFLLGIRGYEFDGYEERISSGGRVHLQDAVRFLREVVERKDLRLLESQTTPC